MKIGLIDVDQHNKTPKFPNIALMKISAWHKAQGHNVNWWFGFYHAELRKLIPFANGFHRVEECGLIEEADDE